ncbi:MAG TPA: DNA methyltransferase [Pyrinomonadaceae bacterium]|nr:DNA methyltransferase [Pyrinomonadaceae bacterium]
MAHWSEATKTLEFDKIAISATEQLATIDPASSDVFLFWLPFPRSNSDAKAAGDPFRKLAEYCGGLRESATVCVLTTPPDAALLIPHLEQHLKFQLWIAMKTAMSGYPTTVGTLSNQHAALLILTKYSRSLRHTKTRIEYTYCPACGKTTKDYGGKKHTYHEYGTLMSDVWRDIDCNPANDIDLVISRLRDMFGLEDYKRFRLVDMRSCVDLIPSKETKINGSPAEPVDQSAKALESQLLNDDCINALHSLPDNSIDFCFADPPYNLKKKYDKWDDALEARAYFAWCDQWLSELHRVLKPSKTLAVLNIPLWAVRHFQYLSSIMDFQAWLAWDGLGFPVRMIMPSHYAIICFSKGKARPLPGLVRVGERTDASELEPLAESYCLRGSCVTKRRKAGHIDRSSINDLWQDIHRLKHNSRRVDHPCQLPPALMRRLFALFTQPAEIVLDCFNGAGTSTLIAQQMNRRFIGIELSSEYHKIAVDRHRELDRGLDPFGKTEGIPTAKNSPVKRVRIQKYSVSKKTLQLDIRRIANEVGHIPTRNEVSQLSQYPINYFDNYFASWGEVCAAARTTGMSENPKGLSKETPSIQMSLLHSSD